MYYHSNALLLLVTLASSFLQYSHALPHGLERPVRRSLRQTLLIRREEKEAGGEPKETAVQEETPVQKKISAMFHNVVEMGFNMDQSVSNFASNSSEITKGAETVKGLVTEVLKVQEDLYKSVKLSNATQDEQVKKAISEAKTSGESLNKALDAIAASPEDANVIKKNYKSMATAYEKIIDGTEKLADAADPVPRFAEEGILPQSTQPDTQKAEGKSTERGQVIKSGDGKPTPYGENLTEAAQVVKSDDGKKPTPSGEKLTEAPQVVKSDDGKPTPSGEKSTEAEKSDVEQSDEDFTESADTDIDPASIPAQDQAADDVDSKAQKEKSDVKQPEASGEKLANQSAVPAPKSKEELDAALDAASKA